MDSEFIKKLTDIVEVNLADENFGVEDLVRGMGISHINLHRKLKTISNQTISQFIREIRLKKARELLLNENLTVSEISYHVGFGSPTYFNKCFHEYFGYPPGEARTYEFAGTQQISTDENHQFPERTPARLIPEPKLKGVNRRSYLVFATVGVIFLLLVSYIIYDIILSTPSTTKSLASTEKSVIVLPFKNLSPDEGNQYLADGIAEDILNHLFRITALRVVSRGSAEQFRESNHSAREIARQMDVNYVLEGSVRRENDKVRISVQLIDARRDQHLWSENYDRQLTDIFTIQSDIAQKVAHELQSVLSPAEKEQIDKILTTNTEAYNYYLMGRFFWNKRTEDGLKRSIGYFEKAIAVDPDYALAHAGLADAYFIQAWWMLTPWSTGFEMAKKTAHRALELDKNLAEAYAVLGSILCYHDWKWEESRATLIKAIQLNPNYSIARQYYSELLAILGENEESRVQINIAMELDPVNFMHRAVSSGLYYNVGMLAESLEEARREEEINPEWHSVRYYYFHIYYRQGNDIKAIETIQQIMAGDTATIKYVNKVNAIYNESGIKGLLHLLIELEQKKATPNLLRIAKWYSLLEEKESALTWIEKAMAVRFTEIPRIYFNSDFKILRTEPRFIKISDQLGLTSYHKRPAK